MPEAGYWVYDGLARVVRQLAPATTWEAGAPQPEVGEVGQIVTINTTNGKVTSVGLNFGEPWNRSWVYPVAHVIPTIEDEVAEAIRSILEGGGP